MYMVTTKDDRIVNMWLLVEEFQARILAHTQQNKQKTTNWGSLVDYLSINFATNLLFINKNGVYIQVCNHGKLISKNEWVGEWLFFSYIMARTS